MTERKVEPPPWREVFAGPRGRLITGLLMLEALVAIYALVVTAIMPAVRDELGGTKLYGLAFAVWGLATIITIPIAGHAADRYGPRRPLLVVLVVQITGLTISGLAPSMEIVIVGLFLQGCAGGALYALSLGTVAKTFPSDVRARVMALLATMWILPGLFGPPLGAALAETVGWRWAFALPIPLLILAVSLVQPVLRTIEPSEDAGRVPVRWSVQVAFGIGVALVGLSMVSRWTIPVAIVGLAIGLPALAHIVPRGTWSARRGLPAAALAMFLLSGAFFTVDSFVPLMLTELHGFSYFQAGMVITVATVTWSLGSWWQSRAASNIEPGTITTIGAALVAAGMVGVATGLIPDAPIWMVYVGWTIAGGGMGVAFPTIPLSVMNASEEGKEAGQLSSTLLMDTLGMTVGAGLGGACIALATSGAVALDETVTGVASDPIPGLRLGIAGAYAIGFIGILVLLVIARRLPGQPRTETEPDDEGTTPPPA
jgi:MFS family permease